MKTVNKIHLSCFIVALSICLSVGIVSSCDDCLCGGKDRKFEPANEFVYKGRRFYDIHGYVDRHGTEHSLIDYEVYYLTIHGHEYFVKGGVYDTPVHLPSCQKCKDERDSIKNEIITDLHNYIDKKLDSLSKVQSQSTQQVRHELKSGLASIRREMVDYD